MKRPRLSRPFCVSMLALAGLLVLSYFPLSRIRAANAGATILPSAGKPLVNLKTPQNLKLTYTGPADAVAALQAGAAIPTALASADFNADGAMDVVAGYSTPNGGVLALMRGNPDAFAPKDTSLYQKAMKGSVPATFLSRAVAFTIPESPDLIVTGDFNGAASIGGGWCLNITPAAVQTTITTSPAGLLVSVDGGTFTAAPLVESWIPGSSHTIATTSPQSAGTGVQYLWSSWSDSGAISHSITVPSSATTYTATFNTQYQLTMVASPSADGSVTPVSGSYYAGGAIIPVTATANAGFQFTNWTSTGGSFVSTTSPSTNFTMPSAPATVTGNFSSAAVQITITTTPVNLLVSVDGGTATTAPLVETWVIGSSHTIATTSPQSGGAGVQYVWSNWSDSGAISHSITVPSSATTYTATFNTQYQLTMVASPSADGSVTPASGSYYAGGAIIPATATANAGFQFSSWTSTGGTFDSTTSASTNFHMPSAPATVTGNFTTAAGQITLTPTSINFGTVKQFSVLSRTVTVKNIGTSKVRISKVSVVDGAGADSDDFTPISLCPSSLAAGKSCEIFVAFYADNLGTPSATLDVTDSAAGSPQTLALTGNVIKGH